MSTFVGLSATVPLGGARGCFALLSSGLKIACKKFDSRIKKHQEIITLAIAKRETVYRLLAKTFAENKVSDTEFQLIVAEFLQYGKKSCESLTDPPAVSS